MKTIDKMRLLCALLLVLFISISLPKPAEAAQATFSLTFTGNALHNSFAGNFLSPNSPPAAGCTTVWDETRQGWRNLEADCEYQESTNGTITFSTTGFDVGYYAIPAGTMVRSVSYTMSQFIENTNNGAGDLTQYSVVDNTGHNYFCSFGYTITCNINSVISSLELVGVLAGTDTLLTSVTIVSSNPIPTGTPAPTPTSTDIPTLTPFPSPTFSPTFAPDTPTPAQPLPVTPTNMSITFAGDMVNNALSLFNLFVPLFGLIIGVGLLYLTIRLIKSVFGYLG